MKKLVPLILAVSLVLSFSSVVYADDPPTTTPYVMIGREIFAGFELAADRIVGALFVGIFFDDTLTARGRFTVILDHNNAGNEVCGGLTQLLRFKLIMNFYSAQ